MTCVQRSYAELPEKGDIDDGAWCDNCHKFWIEFWNGEPTTTGALRAKYPCLIQEGI